MEQNSGNAMAGRTVLVTGGTGGIGLATVLGLAALAYSDRWDSPIEMTKTPTQVFYPARDAPGRGMLGGYDYR
jgi:hypothetical protein